MDLIELHIVQSFPVTCLNRDDVGAPKTAVFGGVPRARVSSQSWKRAIRQMAKEIQPGLFAGTRTRWVVRDLERLYLQDLEVEEARELAQSTADAIGALDSKVPGKVKTLLYFTPMEMGNVVNGVLEGGAREALAPLVEARRELQAARDKDGASKGPDELEKKCKKLREALDKITKKASRNLKGVVKDGSDISIFGRMVADDHSLMIEGAGLFSHAISTHKASNEVEFFSAVDDNPEIADEGAGAGHIGTLEFSSACHYRYVGLNLDLLGDHDHLNHLSEEEFQTVLDAFLRAAILAVPAARKNSMFGFTAPSFVLGLRRRGHPLSLVNAFEKPVRALGNGYIEPSVKGLEEHYSSLCGIYKIEAGVEARIPEVDIDELISSLIEGPAAAGA